MPKLVALRQILTLAAGSLAALFLLDAAAFRTGWYDNLVAPDSYAGRFRAAVRTAAGAPSTRAKLVLVLGDSAMGEGFSARIADQTAARRVRFVNGSVPAASLRTWFYLLREADPQRDKFSVIVLPVEGYDDEDGPLDRDDNTNDLRIVIPALRLADTPGFVRSFRKWPARWQALREATFKGLVYRNDVRDLLTHPRARLAQAEAHDVHGPEWSYGYEGNPRTFDPAAKEIQAMIDRSPSPQTGIYKRYRTYWLDRLIAPYAGSGTRFLIVRAPRNPVPIARYPQPDPHNSIRTITARHKVSVADEHLFDDLEQPQYFFDALHMNAAGRRQFSARLASLVLERFF